MMSLTRVTYHHTQIKSLAEDAASCRTALDRLQHLCSTIARLMDQERDSDIFLAKMAIPEMQLREVMRLSLTNNL